MSGSNINKTIKTVDDLAHLFVRTLKELADKGVTLTLDSLSENLALNDELNSLIALANDHRETLTRPMLESEVERLNARIDEKEEERLRFANRFFETENELDQEKDVGKRMILLLLGIARSQGNEPCFSALDEIRELFLNDAPVEEREKALSRLRSGIAKIDSIGGDSSSGSKSFIGGLFRGGRSDPLKAVRKAAVAFLEDMRTILGKEYAESIDTLRERVESSEDMDYFLSLRKSFVEIIETYVNHIEDDKERITGFIREVSERLSKLEDDLEESSAKSHSHLLDDLSFSENLVSDIRTARETVDAGSEGFENLRTEVLKHLDKLGSALAQRREQYVIRIHDSDEDNTKIRERFKQVVTTLQDKNRILKEQSVRDPLTGIYNRRVFTDRLVIEFERYKRYKTPFSIIFFDVDHFKNVNDTYGHEAGDRALKGLAAASTEILRKVDVLARYGGEEFVVILFETDIVRAVAVAEKLRDVIEHTTFEYHDQVVPITISLGVATAHESDKEPEAIITRADRQLYRAKQTGRNKVVSELNADNG